MQNTKLTMMQSMLYPRRYSAAMLTTGASLLNMDVSVSGMNWEYTHMDIPNTRAIVIPERRQLSILP